MVGDPQDPQDLRESREQTMRDLRASERMPGVERIWMPGEQSHEKRIANSAGGMLLPPQLKASLDKTAADLGIEALQLMA